ncbi:10992_t:CDS:2 [Acaulospora morrowiae]|uniref:10992_t:CDS:1 n=1 Tax=Acaulospora morrowiae TaxID=94023 RepID=A0A9N9AGV2_9GLOM|nr:10992_t:CDS:2 [Acaulospora morrowiae]
MANVNKSNDEFLFNLMLRKFPNDLNDELTVEPPQGKLNVYTSLDFAQERKTKYTKFHEYQMSELLRLETEERKKHRLEFSKFVRGKYGDLIRDGKFSTQSVELYSSVVNVLKKDKNELTSSNAEGSSNSSMEEGEIGDERAELMVEGSSILYDDLYKKFQEEHEKMKEIYQARRQCLIKIQENIMNNIQKLIKDPSGSTYDKQNTGSRFDITRSVQQQDLLAIKEMVPSIPSSSSANNMNNCEPTYHSTTPTSSPPKSYQSLPANLWKSQSYPPFEKSNTFNSKKTPSTFDSLGPERHGSDRKIVDYNGDLSGNSVYGPDTHGESRIGKNYYSRDTDRYSDSRMEKTYNDERPHNYPYGDERFIDRDYEEYIPSRSYRDNSEIIESRRPSLPHDARRLGNNVGYRHHHYPRGVTNFRPFRYVSRRNIRGRPFKKFRARGIQYNAQRGRYPESMHPDVPET